MISDLLELRRTLEEIERPGLARCAESYTEDDLCKLEAKREFREQLEATGLSQRKAAEVLNVKEATLRGWTDTRDLKRHPPRWATRKLGREAMIVGARQDIRALEAAG